MASTDTNGRASMQTTTENQGSPRSQPQQDAQAEREETEGTDARGRRWYHLRPQPPRRSDLMGFNSTWWMAVGWLIVILVVLFPFPWWW